MWNQLVRLLSTMIILSALVSGCAPTAPTKAPGTSPAPTQPPSVSVTPSPTRKPTATPLPPVVLTSSRFGYSITLPAGWQLQEVPGDWNGTTASPAGEPGTDAFYKSNPGEFVPLEIGFLPVNAGTTVKVWEKAEAARPQEWTHPCTTDPNLESATVGGEPALLQRVSCPNHPGVNVYLVHKNQGIYMDYQGNLASIHLFESALQTFTFH